MIYKVVLLAIFLLVQQGNAQEAIKRFYTAVGRGCDSTDAYIYKIWIPDSESYTKRGFYASNNSIYSIEHLENYELNGVANYFHPNGKLYYEVNYLNGNKDGQARKFYPNGKLQVIEFYDSTLINGEMEIESYIIEYYDSLGNQLVEAGEGTFHEFERTDYGYRQYVGKITGATKDSVWNGYHENGKIFVEEFWDRGKLISGKSYWEEGEFEYDKPYVIAEPEGGINSFYNFIASTMKYPMKARRKGIEGRVFVSFEVDPFGNLIEIGVIKGIGSGCDEEAVRVIGSSPKWNPCKVKGKPTQAKFNLAIIFKLN